MIDSIKIRNLKNIRSADVALERLTVLVGANASGKTSVLEAIHYCKLAAIGDPVKVFGYERHCDWLYTRGGTGDMSLRCITEYGIYGISASLPKIPNFSEEKRTTEFLGKVPSIELFRRTPSAFMRVRSAMPRSVFI